MGREYGSGSASMVVIVTRGVPRDSLLVPRACLELRCYGPECTSRFWARTWGVPQG